MSLRAPTTSASVAPVPLPVAPVPLLPFVGVCCPRDPVQDEVMAVMSTLMTIVIFVAICMRIYPPGVNSTLISAYLE